MRHIDRYLIERSLELSRKPSINEAAATVENALDKSLIPDSSISFAQGILGAFKCGHATAKQRDWIWTLADRYPIPERRLEWALVDSLIHLRGQIEEEPQSDSEVLDAMFEQYEDMMADGRDDDETDAFWRGIKDLARDIIRRRDGSCDG